MFSAILQFELRFWSRDPAAWLYFFLFFLLAFGSMAGAAGAFGEGSNSAASIANSPHSLHGFSQFFNKMLLLILPGVAGAGVFRDFKNNVHGILFTYPFSKKDYLFAKFLAAFAVVTAVAAAVQIGLALATFLPSADPRLLRSFDFEPYFLNFFGFVLPNLLLFSVISFAVTVATRSLYTAFVALILCWLLREIGLRLAGNAAVFALLAEPFGESAMLHFTKNWTLAEQNTLDLPLLEPLVFANRILWLAVAGLIFWLIFRFFDFSQTPVFSFQKKQKPGGEAHFQKGKLPELPRQNPDFSIANRLKTVWHLAKTDFQFILKNPAFLTLVALGGAFVAVLLTQINPQTDTKILPTTWSILGFPVFFHSFLIQILTFLYAGVLVHRAKNARFFDLLAATPVPNWAVLAAHFLALLKMQVVLLLSIFAVGAAVQVWQGFPEIEVWHYFFDLFCVHLLGFLCWTCAALFVQTMFENTFLGLFVLVLASFGMSNLAMLGIENPVFQFGKSPADDFFLKYSDLAGHAQRLAAFQIFKIYWLLGGLVLLGVALVFWRRERTSTFGERVRLARKHWRGAVAAVVPMLAAAFFGVGVWLFFEQNRAENRTFSSAEEASLIQKFQRENGHLADLPQPSIASVFVKLDIFPAQNAFFAAGKYILVNRTSRAVDTLLVKSDFDARTKIGDSNFEKIWTDTVLKFTVYRLPRPLPPGDSLPLDFEVASRANTIFERFSPVLKNGTFLKNDIFPRLGYFAETEPPMPDDPRAQTRHYQSHDSHLVDFEAIVSTDAAQTAVAPGRLLNAWTEGGRRFFHFKMERPAKFVFGFGSAVFERTGENFRGVDLQIFHHPQHHANLPNLLDGLKFSLDFNAALFGDLPYKQLKIMEFARSEGTFATLAGDCIPTSEMRFVSDPTVAAAGGVDLPFYVVAHELCHFWWGNAVLPADARGASLLTESVAEYCSAKIYERRFGKRRALRFLEIQRDRYRAGRAAERGQESPLCHVLADQTYISYGKGALALYVLSEKIGEENLHRALKNFFKAFENRVGEYPTSVEFLEFLRRETPADLQFLIREWFETSDSARLLTDFEALFRQNASG